MLLALMLLVAAGPGGWRDLKWGMSPRQVEQTLNRMSGHRSALHWKSRHEYGDSHYERAFRDHIGAGEIYSLHLAFIRERLWYVQFNISMPDAERLIEVHQALRAKYGPPRLLWDQGEMARCGDADPAPNEAGEVLRRRCWLDGGTLIAIDDDQLTYASFSMDVKYWADAKAREMRPVDASKL